MRFFCESITASAEDAERSMTALVRLKETNEGRVRGLGISAANALQLLALLEGHPIVSIGFVTKKLGVSRSTASGLVQRFVDLGILVQRGEKQRYRTFAYEDYLAILREDAEPLE